ncbi:transmembrane protein [Moniliophthora roreri]|uniref:Tricalbin n=1 Tax=Moniliophthora roreri TaxID=221103 RepID=A0A0W0FAI8_MONRR|nr:transmembrane protein [Moniliophthora roreri]
MGDVNSRAPTHTFDPDASPQEKAAAAGKARDQLKSIVPRDNDAKTNGGEKEVPIDIGAPAVLPTITISDSDADEAPQLKVDGQAPPPDTDDDQTTPEAPGAIPQAKAPEIPDWYVVGWRQHAGLDKPASAEETTSADEEIDRRVLELFLTEQFYGEWWHNAGIIIFAVLLTHFLTRFHLGIGWIIIVLAFCATYYSTSLKRFHRRARDDIQRELVKTQLLKNNPDQLDVGKKPEVYESAEWLNHFLSRFWLIYEPVLSTTIISSVDQVLSSNCPPFLDKFTLGTKAPRIDRVWTFERTDDDIVMMDWALNFTPNEVGDLTQKQLATKVNPKIVLSVRVGKGLATAGMPILLEDITFSGRIRVRMKLMSNFPHVQIVDLSFMEKPVIDYVLKPIGGETFGFDVAGIPGLSSFIREMTHATMSPMMYHPNVFTLNLEQLLSGEALDAAVGVVQIVIHSARGIKGTKIGGGTPDPYVAVSIEGRVELAYTRYKHNTYNPTWMETKFILINNLSENIVFNLYDYNDHRKDSLLGSANFALAQLLDDATHDNVVSPLLIDGKERGELRYDISYYPVLKKEEGQDDIPDTAVGIVRLTIHQAKDLDASKSLSGDLNPLAKVFLGSNPRQPIHTTKHFKHTNSPVWESSHEFLCANKAGSVITIKVIDDRDFLKDPVIGYMSVRLEDLLHFKTEAGKDWFPLSNCKSGKIRVSAEWKPVDMAGSLHGANDYKKPIGVVRVWLDRATDVKNVEAALGGKSDPYVRVQVANVTKGRTEVVNNNLNPVWDQIVYVPVHSLKESLLLECMDYQHLTRDRSLGSVELNVSDLAVEDKENASYPYKSTGVRNAQDPIRMDKGNVFKGQLHYTAEFVPALNLRGVKFKDSEDGGLSNIAFGRGAGGVAGSAGVNASTHSDETGSVVQWKGDGASVSSFSSSDDEAQAVPEGITIKRHGHKKNAKSTDTTHSTKTTASTAAESTHTAETSGTNGTNGTNGNAKEEEESGVQMSTEELVGQQSGVLVVNVVSGNLHKKARLELLLDDGYWPCFSTQRAQSRKAQWEYVGEGFIKELDFGQVWLRLNEATEGEKDDIIAEWKGDAKSFLKSTLEGPQSFSLMDQDEKNTSTVVVESRYVPVPVKLEPRESINNQGVLRVTLLDGRDLRAADRSGKSDPYVVFVLNGQRVHKSETVKKTLNPDWNEDFTVSVPSRVHAEFYCEVYDWDQVGRPDPLGNTDLINLAEIEPFQASELTLPLALEKQGQKGRIRLRLLFQPEIIVKSRQKTSTFSSAGRAMTQIGGLPVQAGKGVFHGVTKHVFRRGDKEEVVEVDEVPSGQASQPVAPESFPINAHERAGSGGNDPGTLRVTVIDGKDLSQGDVKPYAVLRVGDKESKTKHAGKTSQPEWNESFTFAASQLTPKMYVWVHDHKTLRKDELLGDGEVDLWRHLNPDQISAAEVTVELHNGNGLVRLRVEYDPSAKFGRQSSISSGSGERMDRTMSISSPSRFSLRGRRPGQEHDD